MRRPLPVASAPRLVVAEQASTAWRLPLVRARCARPRYAHLLALVLALVLGVGWAGERVAVPSFPARAGVPEELATSFADSLRGDLEERGLEVLAAVLITPGIAGSLEVEFTRLVAELERSRYALSGELVARPGAAAEPFAVNVLVVDVAQGRSSDVVSWPLAVATLPRVASEVAALVQDFVAAAIDLPAGDAALFVSTEPRMAEVRIDGVPVGVSGSLDVLALRPGRYELEVRKEGYLPELRTVEVRSDDTRFVHVVLTELAGGSIRVTSRPPADVVLDGDVMGTTPITLTSLPGVREVRIERPGFEPVSFSVSVRNFRVHRVDAVLEPSAPTLLVWSRDADGLLVVDGVLRRDGFAPVEVGLVELERVRAGQTQRVLRAVPEAGVYVLDLDSMELSPLLP